MNCTNINNPDSYGHFREAKITQTKHHWWWKINYIMDNFLPSQNHQGDFVFIEEDHYLSPDFIHLWKLMKEIRKLESCHKINLRYINCEKLHEYFQKFHSNG